MLEAGYMKKVTKYGTDRLEILIGTGYLFHNHFYLGGYGMGVALRVVIYRFA